MGRQATEIGFPHLSIFAAICSLLVLGPVVAQFGGFGGPGGSEPVPAVKSDLPYIRCGACEALAKNAYRQIKTIKDAQKPGKKVQALCISSIIKACGCVTSHLTVSNPTIAPHS